MAKKLISNEVSVEAMKVAKATTRPGQTKEQTKLIAQGVAKGMAEYKKREKAKARERNKERKKSLKEATPDAQTEAAELPTTTLAPNWLPWALLGVSWVGFVSYVFAFC